MKSCALMSLFLFCLFLAAVGGAILLHEQSPVTQQQRAAELSYRQARDAQDLAERQRQSEERARFMDAVMPAAQAAAFLVILLVPVTLGGLGVAVVFFSRRRAALVYPDARGLLPADYDRLRAGAYDGHALAALGGYHSAQIEAAQHPPLPVSVTKYTDARRFAYDGPPPRVIGSPEPPALPAPAVAVPTFAQLLAGGTVGEGRPLVLGYSADGAPLTGSLRDLYSTAVAGLPGAGKSNTEAFLVAQTTLQGGRLIVIDPHADADGSLAQTLHPLAPAMLTAPAASEGEIVKALTVARDELSRRREGATGAPWIVAVDEWTALVRRARVADALITLLEEIAQEGRKLGIFALVSGQAWNAEAAGGTPLRDSLASAFLHRMKPSAARLLVPGVGREVAALRTGQALLYRTSGDLVSVSIPLTTRQDLAAVAGLLPRPSGRDDSASWAPPRRSTYPPAWMPPDDVPSPGADTGAGTGAESVSGPFDDVLTPDEPRTGVDTTSSTSTSTAAPDPDEARRARIRDLAAQGLSRNSICVIVFGSKNKAYLDYIRDALAEAETSEEEG